MENKEEVLKAIDWCIQEYEKSLKMDYSEVRKNSMDNGVCSKLYRTTLLGDYDINFISQLGAKYIKENKKELRKIFPFCFKRSAFKMNLYWCNVTPQIASTKEAMRQSLAIGLYVLNEVRFIIQSM